MYEVLSESTTSSDNEDHQQDQGWLDEAAGGGEPGVDHHVYEHTEPTFVVPVSFLICFPRKFGFFIDFCGFSKSRLVDHWFCHLFSLYC